MTQSGEGTKMPACGTKLSRSRTKYKKIASSVSRSGTNISRNTAKWSGIRESNPRLDLGKVAYYHYTNPA
jgi:hypothetical protein